MSVLQCVAVCGVTLPSAQCATVGRATVELHTTAYHTTAHHTTPHNCISSRQRYTARQLYATIYHLYKCIHLYNYTRRYHAYNCVTSTHQYTTIQLHNFIQLYNSTQQLHTTIQTLHSFLRTTLQTLHSFFSLHNNFIQLYISTQPSDDIISPPEKLFGDGGSTPMPLFCLI